MARDTTDFRPIEGVDELVEHLVEGNKPRDKWRIGTEHEKFPFYVDGNAPVPYGGERGIRFLGLGGSPKWSLAETPKMPKSRYEIMTRYMPTVGTKGLDMMYRTCTIQVNLDFESEADMRRKMQESLKLQPLSTALFANSPFTEGRPNGFQSWRGDIWRDTDNQRSGLLDFCFSPDFGFADYVEWALDVPMYFVIRDGQYHDMTHVTFRQFMAGAARNEIPDGLPTMGDWANHLSTLFPDVRLKRFLEM